MKLTITKEEFIQQGITETRAKMLSAHNELMQSLNKPNRRKSLQHFISQCLQKLELYEDGKLDIDAEMRFSIDQQYLNILVK